MWEPLNDPWVQELATYVARLGCAVLVGGLLGLERESWGRPAGFRTHILVCLGAALAVMCADAIAAEVRALGGTVWLDKGRIAAGVLTGIGFLGAGTIINFGIVHRGLTTAAMLWFAACLGIAIGAGYYLMSFTAAVIALIVVLGFRRISHWVPMRETVFLEIRLKAGCASAKDVHALLVKHASVVLLTRTRLLPMDDCQSFSYELVLRRQHDMTGLGAALQERFPKILEVNIEH